MAAKIFNPPDHLTVPVIDFADVKGYKEKEKQYVEDLRTYLREGQTDEYIGGIIRFPRADGYAEYMVASMKPLHLVHLPLGDAWEADDYAKRLNAKDVKQRIDADKRLNELFSKKR